MEIPVFLFTGFLEAGKTKFIQETLEDKRFNDGARILLILCEEGIEEYNPELFASPNVFVETVDEPEQLTEKTLKYYQTKHNVKKVMIEYNGMWMHSVLYDAMPKNWIILCACARKRICSLPCSWEIRQGGLSSIGTRLPE